MLSRGVRAHLPLRLIPLGVVLTTLTLSHTPASVAAAAVNVSPTASATSPVTVSGSGAIPGRVIDVFVDGKFWCKTKADSHGNFSITCHWTA
jgi:hypothetical protein